MATFDKRVDKDRKTVYRVRVRRKGSAPQIATFHKLADAKTWAQVTEGAVLEGRHFKLRRQSGISCMNVLDAIGGKWALNQ